MGGESYLHDLYVDDGPAAGGLARFRPPPPAPEIEEITVGFAALAEEFPPATLEQSGRVPDEALRRMGELGLFGVIVPTDYGGRGLPFSQYVHVVSRLAPVDLSLSLVSLAHLSIGLQGIILYGSEEQKRRLLPAAARGECIFAYALTEPEIGSDAKHIATTATLEEDGRHYRLSGQKTYITNANYAGAFTVFAQIRGHRPGYMGAFVVEREWEGVTVGEDMPKMGLKASSTAFLRFADVRVPVENRIGEPGEGFRIAMSILNYGRLAVAAAGVGLMEQSVRDMAARAKSRVQFGQPIAEFELIQEKIGRTAADAFVAANMVGFAARELDESPTANVAPETSHCKLFCTTRAWEALYDALQVAGGSGYLATNPYERRLRDWRVTTIFEGTTEIHSIYPSAFLLRAIGGRLPRSWIGRVRTLVRDLARTPKPFAEIREPQLQGYLRLARRCTRRVRWLLRAGLLFHGAGVAQQEFFLRRVTWLSLYAYGLLAACSRWSGEGPGAGASGDTSLLDAFSLDAREALARSLRLGANPRESVLRRIARRVLG